MLHQTVINIIDKRDLTLHSHNQKEVDANMSLSTHYDNSPQTMLMAIAEANTLCYHAQCRYRQASSLAADRSYNKTKYSAQQEGEPLIDALRESHFGTNKLQQSFSLIQEHPALVQKFPVLASQTSSIPIMALENLDASSNLLFDSGNDGDASKNDLVKHCSRILRFVHRCEEISSHQRKYLEAVEAQIKAESPAACADWHQVGSNHHYYHQYYHHRYPMPGPYHIPVREMETPRSDEVSFFPSQQGREDHYEQIEAAGAAEQRYDSEHHSSSIVHAKPSSTPTPNTGDDFEPLSIDEGIDLSLGETHSASAETLASSIVQALGPIIPDEIFTDGKVGVHRNNRKEVTPFHSPENSNKVNTDSCPVTPTSTTTSTTMSTASPPRGRHQETGFVRSKSGNRLRVLSQQQQQQQNRRPPRRQKKRKAKSESNDMLSLALGGRLDFLEKDSGNERGGSHYHSENDARRGNSDDDGPDDGFPFDNRRNFKRSHSC
jgi:hypothetical protein